MRSGDRCDCGGTMRTYRTITRGARRTRYLRCDRCGGTGKEIVGLDPLGRPEIPLPGVVIQGTTCGLCGCRMRSSQETTHEHF